MMRTYTFTLLPLLLLLTAVASKGADAPDYNSDSEYSSSPQDTPHHGHSVRGGAIVIPPTSPTRYPSKSVYGGGIVIPPTSVVIIPLDYDTDGAGALAVAQANLDMLVKLPTDPEKRAAEEARLNDKLDTCLNNGYIMSQTKLIRGSMQRVVLKDDQSKVQGLMDFYLLKKDKQGYIETLCTYERYRPWQPVLIKYALEKIKETGATKVSTDTLLTDTQGQAVLRVTGFKEVQPSEVNQDNDGVHFEYVFEDKE